MSVCKEIGEFIVSRRKLKNLSLEDLAFECNISPSYLRRIEHGQANPTIKELSKIANVLNAEIKNPFATQTFNDVI